MSKVLDVPEIASLCEKIKARAAGTAYPHEICGKGFKWINLVLQGGGTLGICHVGVIYGLELAGFRFSGIAGTSAGAIAALLVAASRENWTDTCGAQLLDVLSAMPSQEFIDGPYLVRRLIKEILLGKAISAVEAIIPAKAAVQQLLTHRGLNPGIRLEEWLQRVLSDQCQISSMEQLDEKIRRGAPEFLAKSLEMGADRSSRLKMIATGLPYGHKFVFPGDADVLDWNQSTTSPALYARASMSIPFFFAPLIVPVRKQQWKDEYDKRFVKGLPREVAETIGNSDTIEFVDGGILSNFPIDIFFDDFVDGKPVPTFGLSMYSSERQEDPVGQKSKSLELLSLAARIFQAARLRRDRDAVQKLPEWHRLAMVNTGPHDWLNFSLDDDSATDLFKRGLEAVYEILRSPGDDTNQSIP